MEEWGLMTPQVASEVPVPIHRDRLPSRRLVLVGGRGIGNQNCHSPGTQEDHFGATASPLRSQVGWARAVRAPLQVDQGRFARSQTTSALSYLFTREPKRARAIRDHLLLHARNAERAIVGGLSRARAHATDHEKSSKKDEFAKNFPSAKTNFQEELSAPNNQGNQELDQRFVVFSCNTKLKQNMDQRAPMYSREAR